LSAAPDWHQTCIFLKNSIILPTCIMPLPAPPPPDASLAFELSEKVLRDRLKWLVTSGAGLKALLAAGLAHALAAAAASGQPGEAPGGTTAGLVRAPVEELLSPFPAHVLVSHYASAKACRKLMGEWLLVHLLATPAVLMRGSTAVTMNTGFSIDLQACQASASEQ
jgi:hypothetical protein